MGIRLLSRLRGWFRGPDSQAELAVALAALEQQAKVPALDLRAAVWNRAGDLCFGASDRSRALEYYGRAVDSYLAAGYYDAAASMCRKMIERFPEVIRAHCTLAFLALGQDLPYLPFRGVPEDVRAEIAAYVEKSRAAGLAETAIHRLHLMAEVTRSPEIRDVLSDFLFRLGDLDGAERVSLAGLQAGLHEPTRAELKQQREQWAQALGVRLTAFARGSQPHD